MSEKQASRVEELMAHIDAMLPAAEPLTYHQRRLVREALVVAATR